MKKLLTACCLFLCGFSYAQIGIGTTTPNAKAALDITSTNKGLLIPRMDSLSRIAITSPPDGLMIFQIDQRKGFFYALGGTWLYLPDKLASGDNLGSHNAEQDVALNSYDLRLRTASDANHGVGWYGNSGSIKNWNSQNIDGPVVYGFLGGALGTKSGGLQSVLTWKNNGRVGINNPDPQQALDVTGSIKAQALTYTSAHIHYLNLAHDAFTSTDPAAYNTYRAVNASGNDNVTAGLWLSGGTAGQAGYVSAPVTLPDGATVTNLQVTGIDNDGTAVNLSATLGVIQTATNSTSAYAVAFKITTGTTTEVAGWQTVSTGVNHIIRNDLYAYKVVVKLNQNSGGTTLSHVRITYTVSSPE